MKFKNREKKDQQSECVCVCECEREAGGEGRLARLEDLKNETSMYIF